MDTDVNDIIGKPHEVRRPVFNDEVKKAFAMLPPVDEGMEVTLSKLLTILDIPSSEPEDATQVQIESLTNSINALKLNSGVILP